MAWTVLQSFLREVVYLTVMCVRGLIVSIKLCAHILKEKPPLPLARLEKSVIPRVDQGSYRRYIGHRGGVKVGNRRTREVSWLDPLRLERRDWRGDATLAGILEDSLLGVGESLCARARSARTPADQCHSRWGHCLAVECLSLAENCAEPQRNGFVLPWVRRPAGTPCTC